MRNLDVVFVNTNRMSLEDILSSPFLTKEDLESLSKFKADETKKEKACSLILRNKYIGKYYFNEFGKPLSDDVFFNISHSKGVVVFVKDTIPIGIDIEKIRPIKEGMIDYISSVEEKEYIKNEINFFEVWTNKESLAKNIGTGIKDTISEIPALPVNGMKEYKNKKYYSQTIMFDDYIITVTRETDELFQVIITDKENIYG